MVALIAPQTEGSFSLASTAVITVDISLKKLALSVAVLGKIETALLVTSSRCRLN